MSTQTADLPGWIAVIPTPKAVRHAAAFEPGGAGGAGALASVISDMSTLARAGALPARVAEAPRRLIVYTQRHRVVLYPTKDGDAYRLGHTDPLTFADHERLLRASILVRCPAGFRPVNQLRDLRGIQGLSAYGATITRAWAAATADQPAPDGLPPQHADYLDLLTEAVEATRDIEIERQRTARPVPYASKGTGQAQRHSARGLYSFRLLRPAGLPAGAPVSLAGEPDLRGRVVQVTDGEVVVRFDDAIDYRRIPPQGSLQVLPSERVYRAQLAAIDVLREGQSADPGLLATLVDRRLGGYSPDGQARPLHQLDPAQLTAFQRALTVPDQLLILGPPGTGKTRTISEIAAACAARRQRVLVTSHTNRAVDNVLERLPGHILSVRVGNEDSMTRHARRFMVETQVDLLRADILTATESSASLLAAVAGADRSVARWHGFLLDQLANAVDVDDEVREKTAALRTALERVAPALTPRLAVIDTVIADAREQIGRADAAAASARSARADADTRADSGGLAGLLLGWFFVWLARRRQRLVDAAELALAQARADATEAENERGTLREQAGAALARDPAAAALAQARSDAEAKRKRALADVADAAARVRDGLLGAVPVAGAAPALAGAAPEAAIEGWRRYARQLGEAITLAERRAELLAQWRARVTDPGDELHREMVRYADVVAATCIGTETSPLLAGLDFDLAIVDEAGQISTPNLLVPLVRARRSVLVGDHHQLPPFLDSEVQGWVDSLRRSAQADPGRAERIAGLLKRSAFEDCYATADDEHRVMLTVQRRMPPEIADFVSRAFYNGALRTVHAGAAGDPVFARPFAMVDTADQPEGQRRERRGRQSEEWEAHGYVNELEAALITQLVTVCASAYRDWAVIVPYRAQVERIRELITMSLGGDAADSVGTVDAFQGGERDLIVYGCTRSNARGDVGFLREQRRLNVAVTRARRQLVLVGDTTTLTHASDEPFAELMRSLIAYLRGNGDIRASREVAARLCTLAAGHP